MHRVALLVHRLRSVPAGHHRSRHRHTMRALDELRAARPYDDTGRWSTGAPTVGPGHTAVSHALRSI